MIEYGVEKSLGFPGACTCCQQDTLISFYCLKRLLLMRKKNRVLGNPGNRRMNHALINDLLQ